MSRPSKEHYLMSLALLAAQRASCPRRKVGCVLVNGDYHVVSTGYNGPPKGMINCTDVPCGGQHHASGQGLNTCVAVHAEINALNQARDRLKDVKSMYVTTQCCDSCVQYLDEILTNGEMPNLDIIYFFDGYSHKSFDEVFKRHNVIVSKLDKNLDENGLLFKTAEMLGLREKRVNDQVLCVGGALHGSLVTCKGNYLKVNHSHCVPEELNQLYRFEGATIAKDVMETQQYYRVIYQQTKWQRFEIMRFNELTDEQFGRLLHQLRVNNPQEFFN